MTDPRAEFAWAEADDIYFVYCITMVLDRSPEDVVRTLVPDPVVALAPAAKVVEWAEERLGGADIPLVVQAELVDSGWTLVVEDNGFAASDAAVIAALSEENRTAVSLFCNVNAVMRLIVARNGRIVRDIDPLIMYDTDEPPLAEEDGIPFPGATEDDLRPRSGSLALMKRLTGVAVTPDDLTGTDRPGRIAVGHYL